MTSIVDMNKEIIEVSEFQRERLRQLEDGLININSVERTMQFTGKSVIFTGGEDDEKQIDREVLKGASGGLRGIISELIYEYKPDPLTGRDVRVKNKEMKAVVHEIIEISNIIKNQ